MSLVSKLEQAALPVVLSAAGLLAGCNATLPLQGGGKAVEGTPNAFEVPQQPAAEAPKAASVAFGIAKCNKNMTAGTVVAGATGADAACLLTIVSGAPEQKAAAAATAPARKGKAAAPVAAPVATVPAAALPKPLAFPAQITAPECGVTSTGLIGTLTRWGQGAANLAEQAVGNRAGQAGGAIGGNIGAKGAKDAAAAVTGTGRGAATTAATPLTAAETKCNDTLSTVAKGEFQTQVEKILKDWKAANTGFVPVVTFSSELTAAQEVGFRSALTSAAQTVGGRVVAPAPAATPR